MPMYAEDVIKENRLKLRRIWESKEWIAAKYSFLEGKVCWSCGKKATVAHHPTDEYYGKNEYINLHISGCIPLCNSCHLAGHKGLVLCPNCKRGYTGQDSGFCKHCIPPEVEEAREVRKIRERKLKRHLRKEAQERYKRDMEGRP